MKNKKGYTLVEVIISFTLILVVMIYLLRTIVVLTQKNTDLLTYEEFSVYENNLLNDIYDDIELAYEADKLVEKAVVINNNEITFKDINKKLLIDENNESIIYNDTIYQLPENVKFRKEDNKICKVEGVLQSTHDYYIITIYVKVNKNDENIKIVYQNKNDSDLHITYNPNGGEFEDEEYTGIQHVKYGLNKIEVPKVKKRGYDFSKNKTATGWYKKQYDADETVDTSKEVQKEEQIKGPTTYYAYWNVHHYTIKYNLNGGSATNPSSYTVEDNAIKLTNPTRTGYTFKGWSGTDLSGDTNKEVTIPSNSIGDREYTANWTPYTYTVKYDGNGATGGSTASSTHTYGVAKKLTSNAFTKTGYSFAGWATSASGAVAYSNGQSVTNLTSTNNDTVKLFAKWSANTLTIAYNGNGATGGSTASHTCSYDGACSLKSNGFTKTGYNFSGWRKDNTGDLKSAGSSIKNVISSGTATYYSQWSAKQYTIEYIYTGSGYESCSTTYHAADNKDWTETVTYGVSYYIQPNWWSCPGYTFQEWNEDPDERNKGEPWTPGNTWVWTYTKNVKLYSRWKKDSSSGGGSGCTPSYGSWYNSSSYQNYRTNTDSKCSGVAINNTKSRLVGTGDKISPTESGYWWCQGRWQYRTATCN